MSTFILDIDGTICQPKRPLRGDMMDMLIRMIESKHTVILITGSPYEKLYYRFNHEFINKFLKSGYGQLRTHSGCAEVVITTSDVLIEKIYYRADDIHKWHDDLHTIYFSINTFKPNKCDLEETYNGYNFSMIPSNSSDTTRRLYKEHDKLYNEREKMIDKINEKYSEFLSAYIGGQVSIDICKKGLDKSIILEDINETDMIYFFGDKIAHKYGNDRSLAAALLMSNRKVDINPVSGPQETLNLLKKLVL